MTTHNPYKKGGMFEGASPLLFERAKELRKKMTHAEIVLWLFLKQGINGMKFRRQHPIGFYIADFYCHKAKLIIEVDGSIHNEAEIIEADLKKQKELEEWGYRIIRFTNEQIMKHSDKVMISITNTLMSILNNQNKTLLQTKECKAPFRGFGG